MLQVSSHGATATETDQDHECTTTRSVHVCTKVPRGQVPLDELVVPIQDVDSISQAAEMLVDPLSVETTSIRTSNHGSMTNHVPKSVAAATGVRWNASRMRHHTRGCGPMSAKTTVATDPNLEMTMCHQYLNDCMDSANRQKLRRAQSHDQNLHARML